MTSLKRTFASLLIVLVLLMAFASIASAAPTKSAPASPKTANGPCTTTVDRVMSNTGWVDDTGNTFIYSQVIAKVDYIDGNYCSHAYGKMGIWYRAGYAQCSTMHATFEGEAWGGAWTVNQTYTLATCGSNGQAFYLSTPVYYVPASNWCRLQEASWGSYGPYTTGNPLFAIWYPQGHC